MFNFRSSSRRDSLSDDAASTIVISPASTSCSYTANISKTLSSSKLNTIHETTANKNHSSESILLKESLSIDQQQQYETQQDFGINSFDTYDYLSASSKSTISLTGAGKLQRSASNLRNSTHNREEVCENVLFFFFFYFVLCTFFFKLTNNICVNSDKKQKKISQQLIVPMYVHSVSQACQSYNRIV